MSRAARAERARLVERGLRLRCDAWLYAAQADLVLEALTGCQRARPDATREASAMAFALSHDLRQPLVAAELLLTAAAGGTGTDAARAALGDALLRIDGLGALLVERPPLDAETLDLASLVRQIADRIDILYPRRTIAWDLPSEATLVADERLLSLALGNLLDNAVKHSGRTDPAVRLAVADRRVVVEDNGPGVPAARVPTLFVLPWRRGSTELAHRGFGLSVTRRAVEAHGGCLDYEPMPGGGSRFAFRLGDL